jgi:hypothetical protein
MGARVLINETWYKSLMLLAPIPALKENPQQSIEIAGVFPNLVAGTGI